MTQKVQDFDDRVDVIPVADPNIYSMAQRVTLANENLKIATSNLVFITSEKHTEEFYEALGTKDIDSLLSRPDEVPVPKDPAIENLEAMQMKKSLAFPQQDHDAHIAGAQSLSWQQEWCRLIRMVYANLQAHISTRKFEGSRRSWSNGSSRYGHANFN